MSVSRYLVYSPKCIKSRAIRIIQDLISRVSHEIGVRLWDQVWPRSATDSSNIPQKSAIQCNRLDTTSSYLKVSATM